MTRFMTSFHDFKQYNLFFYRIWNGGLRVLAPGFLKIRLKGSISNKIELKSSNGFEIDKIVIHDEHECDDCARCYYQSGAKCQC